MKTIMINDKEEETVNFESAQNELKILKRIKHENIIKYHDHFKNKLNNLDYICIICEYCKVLKFINYQ